MTEVAMVVGAARGCGRAVALELAAAGADIAACDVADATYATLGYPLSTAADLEETIAAVRALGRRAIAVNIDIRDHQAVAVAAKRAESELGAVTRLVVAAGVVSAVDAVDMSRAQWDEVVSTNLTGAFQVLQHVVPAMVARRQGAVVLICGLEARRGYARLSHVAAAAWGLVGMAKSIALEVAGTGVRVNVVVAGPLGGEPVRHEPALAGPFLAGPADGRPLAEQLVTSSPQARAFVEPRDVAAAVAFLTSEAARSVTGAVLDVDLGRAGSNSA
jgi:NAD(P)-dependent dehydrogenase (short-subunit alcohol dehydrogenase family)